MITFNENTREQLNFLLDNNMEVNIHNENYEVKNDRGVLIVVCKSNGFISRLEDNEVKNCYTSKWNVREYEELEGFNIRA